MGQNLGDRPHVAIAWIWWLQYIRETARIVKTRVVQADQKSFQEFPSVVENRVIN
jgi:hypothetical protein